MAVLVACLTIASATVAGFKEARGQPLVRRGTIELPDWPAGSQPRRVLLMSDIHMGNLTMDPERWQRIVAEAEALRPDLVLIAGDLVSGSGDDEAGEIADVARVLSRWHPPLGKVAVLGNHDNWSVPATIRRSLEGAGVTVLENGAVRRGPLLIGMIGDTVSGHARLKGTLTALQRLQHARPGAVLYLAHSPDIVRWLPAGHALLLAGHTHCGQVAIGWLPVLFPVSRKLGNIFRCGKIVAGDKTVVVTAGLGTSNLPVRLGAPPDMWLVTLRAPAAAEEP